MIEIPMRYKVKFAKMINKLQIELELDRQNQHGEKRENTNQKYKECKSKILYRCYNVKKIESLCCLPEIITVL